MIFGQVNDSLMIKKIFDETMSNGKCYEWLDHLANNIGGRLAGSEGAEQAVKYTKELMDGLGLDSVFLQELMVPHWVRGEKEYAEIVGLKEVPICALGGSIGTEIEGITAQVIEVKSFDELASIGIEKIRGKIVFYNRAMDPTHYNTFHSYSGAVGQRWAGAMYAAKYEAVGAIVRSMSLSLDDHPHTGSMGYSDTLKKVPGVAISTNGAELLSSQLKSNPDLKFFFKMSCKTLPEKVSYNVVGEIRGSTFPEEIIVIGGHLDSWDNGDGAHDDGAGCMQAIEVFRVFKSLGVRPKRTIRAVMFMNEENGARGGKKYAELSKLNHENHIAAIESDAGGFSPRGFGINTTTEQLNKIIKWQPLLLPYGIYNIGKGYGGVDINRLKDQGTVLIGLLPDIQRYFDYHHTSIDTFDKVNKRELELGGAAMAALVYLISVYGL